MGDCVALACWVVAASEDGTSNWDVADAEGPAVSSLVCRLVHTSAVSSLPIESASNLCLLGTGLSPFCSVHKLV